MPHDLYAAYNSLSVAQKKEAYDYIMFLSARNLPKPIEKKARTTEEINRLIEKVGNVELFSGDASLESVREVLKNDVW